LIFLHNFYKEQRIFWKIYLIKLCKQIKENLNKNYHKLIAMGNRNFRNDQEINQEEIKPAQAHWKSFSFQNGKVKK
jgi:hypothetical protein